VNRWLPWLLVVALAGGLAFALLSKNTPSEPVSALPAPPLDNGGAVANDEPEPSGAAEPGAPDETLTGVVKEHFDVPQYTYLHLATDSGDKGDKWAAVYRAPVKDGTTVTVIHAAQLSKFHSRELNRDFDRIWFGMLPGHETAPVATAASGAPQAPAPSAAPVAAAPPPKGVVAIADLAKGAAAFDGKQVTVAGHVVKETDGILGRNWIHLQDGSGNAKDGNNDVLVTTADSDAPHAIGQEVTATGTVRTNQDFGSGYAYKFMLEKAALAPRTR
jgi:hypothetical protein